MEGDDNTVDEVFIIIMIIIGQIAHSLVFVSQRVLDLSQWIVHWTVAVLIVPNHNMPSSAMLSTVWLCPLVAQMFVFCLMNWNADKRTKHTEQSPDTYRDSKWDFK